MFATLAIILIYELPNYEVGRNNVPILAHF